MSSPAFEGPHGRSPQQSYPRVQVYIVAGFGPLRTGLSEAVGQARDMAVVGQADSLHEMARDTAISSADVVLVDADAVKGTPRQTYARLEERMPALKALFLGTREDGEGLSFETLKSVIALHTTGFVFKEGRSERLLQAIRLVASGAFVCETDVIRRVLERLTRAATNGLPDAGGPLSQRETEVLTLVSQGLSNKEIGRRLFLSEGTIKAHVSHIMNKLGLERRTELVRYAIANGVGAADPDGRTAA